MTDKRYDDVISYCECGEPKIALKDGVEVQLRCRCDWKRGFFERIRRTVHPDYWEREPKTILDWDPDIFRREKAESFFRLMQAQKVALFLRLYGYCFELKEEREDKSKVYGIDRSIATGRNLYIRGPGNSGRGLLVSMVKTFCAMRGISVTPLPGDFAIFKSELQEAGSYGKDGTSARIAVSQNYLNVDVLALESLCGDKKINMAGHRVGNRARVADAIDNLVAKRMAKEGSILVTSHEFVGEIGETLGDKLFAVLDSPSTTPVLMFHPREGNSLLLALQKRRQFFHDIFQQELDEDEGRKKSKKTSQEKRITLEQAELLRESFYFGDAFPKIPGAEADVPMSQAVMTASKGVQEIYSEFETEKKANSSTYRQGRSVAIGNAVRSCRELSSKMTEREISETGKLLSLATSDDDLWQKAKDKAKEIKARIAGEKAKDVEAGGGA